MGGSKSLNKATGGWCGPGSCGGHGRTETGVRVEEEGSDGRWGGHIRSSGEGFVRMPSLAERLTSKIGSCLLASISC